MTQEQIQLVLKDLCARLPYGGMIKDTYSGHYGRLVKIGNTFAYFISELNGNTLDVQFGYIKPYLRPMSSMTEEELFNYKHLDLLNYSNDGFEMPDFHTIDWLNSHHFDYRNLIEKGLALEAPKDMYKTE